MAFASGTFMPPRCPGAAGWLASEEAHCDKPLSRCTLQHWPSASTDPALPARFLWEGLGVWQLGAGSPGSHWAKGCLTDHRRCLADF